MVTCFCNSTLDINRSVNICISASAGCSCDHDTNYQDIDPYNMHGTDIDHEHSNIYV
jgi:hypothetical protein